MALRQHPAGRLAAWRLPLLVASLATATLFILTRVPGLHSADSAPPPRETPAVPSSAFFAKIDAAKNPEQLILLVDDARVVGWISGTKDHRGKEVVINGPLTEKVKVQEGNLFTWDYQVNKPTQVDFALGELKQTVTLKPLAKLPPSIFFATDRHVYRPGQTLHFAAFLRQLDSRGDFAAMTDKNVEIQLRSKRKAAIVQRWKAKSDETGRITGSYRFANADPLDSYELLLPGYEGKAQLHLAEYRKAKVQLKITGERAAEQVKLHFEAIDFMDRPVPAEKVVFTAQVVRQPEPAAPGTRKVEDFVYAGKAREVHLQLSDLSADERLLLQSDPAFNPELTGLDSRQTIPLFQTKGEVKLQGKSSGDFLLKVPTNCQQPGHAVVVEAILTDASGREERRHQTIPLEFLSDNLKLTLSRQVFDVGEAISVTMTGPDAKKREGATLVAMRLSANPTAVWVPFNNMGLPNPFPGIMGANGIGGIQGINGLGGIQGLNGFNGIQGVNGIGGIQGVNGLGGIQGFNGFGTLQGFNGINGFQGMNGFNGMIGMGMPLGRWQQIEQPESVKRALVTATVFKGDTATLRLTEPGAYKLVAIVEMQGGKKLQQEVGCLIQPRNERQGLLLRLDGVTWKTGDTLTGTVHTRFAGARVLLTVRDSTGTPVIRTLTTDKNGQAAIKEVLPAGLRYGCVVTAQYVEDSDGGVSHLTSQTIHVEPADRILKIEAKHKLVCSPGEMVTIDVQVDRKEPVDLAVSVFDQALMNIKSTQGIDIRDFYLADERAITSQARDLLEQRLAGVTVASLMRKAKQKLGQQFNPGGDGGQHFSVVDVATLLQMAGINARASFYDSGLLWKRPAGKDALLLDLLNSRQQGHRIHVSVLHDVFILTGYNPDQPQPRIQPMYLFAPNFQMMGMGGMAMMGMGGMAGFGGGGLGGMMGIGAGGGMMGMGGGLGGLNGSPSFQAPLNIQRPHGNQLRADSDQQGLQIRRDFSDSAYWNAKLRTDAKGKAQVQFKVPDSLTAWQVVVTGISRKMHVGQASSSFQVSRPIMVAPILPRVFTQGDTVKVAANVVNRSGAPQVLRVKLKVENGEILNRAQTQLTLDKGQSELVYWTFQPGQAGFTQLLFSAECAAGSDASLKRLAVTRSSVPEVITRSGFCKDKATIDLPEGVDPKTATLEVRLVPTLLADLVDTLDYLVEYPYGCVEQTMSRFLPAIKVAQVLQHFQVEHVGLKKKLPGCVEAGIKRLLELQQADGGWGWNGSSGTHEMMTPYALYGLLQAEKAGYTIGSETAIKRGLARLRQFIDAMNEPQASDRIYCMYVYGHRHEIDPKWWEFIADLADRNALSDGALALAVQLAVNKGKKDLASGLADQLRKRAEQANGLVWWKTAHFSRWVDDPLEITATALRALVLVDASDPLIPGVVAYFNSNKRGNRWNSTKDTALIVHALCEMLARQNLKPGEKARVVLRCNEGDREEVVFTSKTLTRSVMVPGKQLKAGTNTIAFAEATPGVMYRLVLRHLQAGGDIKARDAGIQVSREFWLLDSKGKQVRELRPGEAVARGSYLESVVRARRQGAKPMQYVLVENPRPSSCEFIAEDDRRFSQQSTPFVLREERETHLAWHHEQTPALIEDRCVLYAELTGEFIVAPAHVELMYQPEVRGHSGTFRFKVVDR